MNIPIGTYEASGVVKVQWDFVELDTSRHTLITGKSGVGKSTMLTSIAAAQIASGDGLLLEDPHGDLADAVLNYCIPRNRLQDVILIDPLSKLVPGLNIFDTADPEKAVQYFLSMSKSISGEAGWGPETERILNAAADAVAHNVKRATIADIHKFLMRPKFRQRLFDKSRDPLLADFIAQYDDKETGLRPSERMAKFSAPINKVDKFLRPHVRPMVGQESCLDFRDAMDTGKIILCRLPKGELGAITASLIGSVIMAQVFIAALRRKENRRPFLIIADEVANFTHGIDLPTMLSESRKYGITLVPATQALSQLGDLRPVFGNCSNLVTFRMGGADAKALEDELGGQVSAETIVGLPDRVFASSLLVNGDPFVRDNIHALPPVKLKKSERADPRAVRNWSLEKYGKDREKMDKLVMASLS